MASQSTLKGFETLLEGTHLSPTGSVLSFSHTPIEQHRPSEPVIVLLHGWPQSRFLFRHVIPPLTSRYTLFVPDLPGYGRSTGPSGEYVQKQDRTTVGISILSAARSVYGSDASFILIGHDRGARLSQRLATDNPEKENIRAVMLMDIVPYVEQWESARNPAKATAIFHWSFLPVMQISVPMIKAYGGGRFCRDILLKSGSSSEKTRVALEADGAIDHYVAMYAQDHVIEGAAADYKAGAQDDYKAQLEDRKQGKMITIPTYIIYSESYLGKAHDMARIWAEWVEAKSLLKVCGVGNGAGHYLAEEEPEDVNNHIEKFLSMI